MNASTAAAIFKSNISNGPSIGYNSGSVNNQFIQFPDNGDLSQEERCHQAFKTSSYEEHKERNPRRVAGTCQWVLKHPQFQEWRHGYNQSLLWISADPGCGKSVLSKALVDGDLEAKDSEAVCYFFFKDNEEQDNLSTALCAILHQLFMQQPELLTYAIPTWKSNQQRLHKESHSLWRVLRSVTSYINARPTICVFDALDECRDEDRRLLIELLCDLQAEQAQKTGCPKLKAVVTSRPYDNVQRWFREATNLWPQLRLYGENENDYIHEEINSVITGRVNEIADTFSLPKSHEDQLRYRLFAMEHRTYLWLHLTMEEIRQAYADNYDPDDVIIPTLPVSVEDAYERLLQKITPSRKPAARRALLIILGARRALTIGELAIAMGIAESFQNNDNSVKVQDKKFLLAQIRHWCGLFVYIQHERLFLIHQTAKEYLMNQQTVELVQPKIWRASFRALDVETELTHICMAYLNWTEKSQDSMQDRERTIWVGPSGCVLHDTIGLEAFWEYCAEFWVTHCETEGVLKNSLIRERALTLYNDFTIRTLWTEWSTYMISLRSPPQHAMASMGHSKILTEWLKQPGIKIDEKDKSGSTALIHAIASCHHATIQLLLSAGADVNLQGGAYGTALQAACLRGHSEIVQILLDAGADVNLQGGAYGTALQAACLRGNSEIVQILLDAGADVNLQGGEDGTALQVACLEGNNEIIQMLLNADADVNLQGGEDHTALQAACWGGHSETVQILLDAGADVNLQGGKHCTALQAACREGNSETVQVLLNAGADVNLQGGQYGTALQAACSARNPETIQKLLDAGADVNLQGGLYGTALQAAFSARNSEVIQKLLDAGAEHEP